MSAPKISLSLGASKKPPPTNGVKRSHAALRDPDAEDDDQQHGKAQVVSHFDRSAGGAIDEKKIVENKGPLVIESLKNRDWKEAGQRNKRMRYAQVAEEGRNGEGMRSMEVDVEAVEARKPEYGLNLAKPKDTDGDVATNGDEEAGAVAQNGDRAEKHQHDAMEQAEQPRTRSADEEAMDALLGNTKQSTMVLPALSEEQAFERDYKDAPDMASLADYDRVPVEEFGAAMLRGMGWKDGEGIGANRGKKAEQTKMPVRRPGLLGIGAKEEAAVAEEMGAWGKAAKGKGGEVKIYNPVLLRDKRTGEMFTEEEAEKRKAQVEREKYAMEFEEKERRQKEKVRDRRRDRDGSEDRRDRNKRESSGERRERKERERRRDDSDEEYYRRKKEKERERRRRERDDDRDDDRRRHDSHRERRKDYDRRR